MKILIATALYLKILASGLAQETFPLWPDGAPGALGMEEKDRPALTAFLPPPGTTPRGAVIVCPGGGYGGLAPHEGGDYARWLNEQGIAGFVLRYRLGTHGYRHPTMLHDATRAVRTVRARATEWQLDPKRIGIMGSSAGGHLASTVLTHWDHGAPESPDAIERQSSRPDLGILCYPVISMGANTHSGSRRNLLGPDPSEDLIRLLSNELQITSTTPPCFVWHTWEDQAVKLEGVLDFAAALQKHKVPFDLHVYQKGAHGLGLGSRTYDPSKRHPWTRDCAFWLKEQGFTTLIAPPAEKSGKEENK